MIREELSHALRAAATVAKDGKILVIGSQAILASFGEDELPVETTLSVEVDLAFLDDPDERKSDLVDGMIGDGSQFHRTHAYYAQGVSVGTAVLPGGWETRVVPYQHPDSEPSKAVCLEPHDLVIAKLVAGREKDLEFATALIGAGLVDPATLRSRAETIPRPHAVVTAVLRRIDRSVRLAELD